MQQTAVTTAVWQRRTHKIIAGGITIIGVTMMLSLIPQCIYIGIVFVTFSLVWLGWLTMKDKKVEPPRPENHPNSPILFLVASHHLRHTPQGPTLPDPNDKPPTYDQILKLDGLPPDYYSILSEKPPRYEDVNGGAWGACALPVELYSHELACVHTTSPSSLRHPDTPSFFQEVPASWASLTEAPSSVYTAAHNPAFSSDDPKVYPLLGLPVETNFETVQTTRSLPTSHPSSQSLYDKYDVDDDGKPPPDMK